ncbi:sulfurtransferase [Lacinutrix sp. Hel_I_90]|uniref:sulfurtransferase n=1 Tax=Lacinutrix sp. Hel_I_90 TaxID=1249999 RepID=UPI0005C80968|nr:sulfurtransferase [Lacinutrix sp. Hel_I_90]
MSKITRNSHSVSVQWLHDHLQDENSLVFDASIPKVTADKSDDRDVQIPNTQFFDIKNKFSDTEARFPNTMPSEKQFQEEARKLGVNQDSTIIAYDDLGLYSSARVWWLFKIFGHDNVAVLDGGLPEWINQGYKTEAKQENNKPIGDFEAKYNAKHVVYYDHLEALSKDSKFKIIDARSSDRFNGLVAEPRAGLRSGTISNSVNLPYHQVLNGTTLKPEPELRLIFKTLANENQHLVFSCGSGITASVLSLAATIAGYKNSVYDGSWTEYGTLKTN